MSNQTQGLPTENYCLGVDGGGSKTLAIIVDSQGNECGRGLAGGANYNAVGLESAVLQLRQAVHEAVRAAMCALPLTAALFGVAGVDRPEDHTLLFPFLQPFARIVHLSNDAELLLSAFEGGIGVALIAGTGSIAFGRNRQGIIVRVGGWGHILGDEGSGYEVGRLALQAVARAHDGRGPKTSLLDAISEFWRLANVSDMIEHIYLKGDKAKIAGLSRIVCRAAKSGDVVAQGIIDRAASELALLVTTVSERLGAAEDGIALALGGGLLIYELELREQVIVRVRRHIPVHSLLVVEQPAIYAARAALRLAKGR